MIRVEASVEDESGRHRVAPATSGSTRAIAIPPGAGGRGMPVTLAAASAVTVA